MIQLDQLLKWADVIQSGGEIRILMDEKKIKVNGGLCLVKRKQLHAGDVVTVQGEGTYEIVKE